MKASTSIFAVMRSRLKVRNLIKYSDRISLDRDLLILEKALNGKIPEFDNRPFPSSPGPLYQNEVRCSTFLVEMSFICMRMKNHFHIKG